jgi:tetratricopeptide (TPR) repeat protein
MKHGTKGIMSIFTKHYPSIFFSLGFVLFAFSVNAQNNKIDSLKTALVYHKAKDTTRVDLINHLAKAYLRQDSVKTNGYLLQSATLADSLGYTNGKADNLLLKGELLAIQSYYEEGFNFYEQALTLYEKLNSPKGKTECLQLMGYYKYRRGLQKEAIALYKKAFQFNQELKNEEKSFELLTSIGWSFIKLSNYDEALANYQKALRYKTQNTTLLINTYSDLGIIYSQQDNLIMAVEYYNKAIEQAHKSKNQEAENNAMGNLGVIYHKMEKFDKAIESYKKAIHYFKDKNKEALASCYNNLGLVYKDNGQLYEATEALNNARKLYEKINNISGRAFTLNNLGDILLEQNDLRNSERYVMQALELNTKIESSLGRCVSYLVLAKIYARRNKADLALEWALKSSVISKHNHFTEYQRDAYKLKSQLYSNLGNYKKAFESHQQFKLLNDSLFNKKKVEKIAQIESEYKYKQALDSANIRELKLTKTVLTTSQDLAKSRQNYLWAVIGILVTSILLSSIVFFQKLKTIKIKNQNIVTEQKLLRSQMTPHFIFNSLSVLQGMILDKQEKKSVTYLSKFSKLLRIVLENSRDKIVPLIQELDALDNYMILQNMDAEPPYNYSLVVDENIDINRFLVPPMLIQPFIENAIEHAFPTNQTLREIVVHLSFRANELHCTITDNGVGIDAASNSSKTSKKSLATTITNERLNLLAKDFKVQGSISVEDRKNHKQQGTRVILIIPYKTTEIT